MVQGCASKKSHCLFSSISTQAKSVSSSVVVVCSVKSSGPPTHIITWGLVLVTFTLAGCAVEGIKSLMSPRGFACSVPVTVSVFSVRIVENAMSALHPPEQVGTQNGFMERALARMPKVMNLL